jgi:hypothetical protein
METVMTVLVKMGENQICLVWILDQEILVVCPTLSTISFAKRNLDRECGENEKYTRFDSSNVDFSNIWWKSSMKAFPTASQEERAAGNVTGTSI